MGVRGRRQIQRYSVGLGSRLSLFAVTVCVVTTPMRMRMRMEMEMEMETEMTSAIAYRIG